MKVFLVVLLVMAMAVPALAQQQTVILDNQGRPAVVGQQDSSGNIIYYDLNQGRPTYYGQQQGQQTVLQPFPAPTQPLGNSGSPDPYKALDVPRTPADVLK